VKEINQRRKRNGLGPLRVLCIREVKADDAKVVSASRIVRGEIDRDGRRWEPIRVAVSTDNQTKVRAVKNVFTQIFGYVEVKEVHVESPPRQPLGASTIRGSIERAEAAVAEPNVDYGVGIEAGLLYIEELDRHFDVQYCTIIDAEGNASYGHGPGFEYPPEVTRAALHGVPVGELMSKLTGIEKIGHRNGSIGYLSNGAIDRTSLTEIAVLMALIPRIRAELYRQGVDAQAVSASDTAWR
jgi:inosine/xanthosine triphosphatase